MSNYEPARQATEFGRICEVFGDAVIAAGSLGHRELLLISLWMSGFKIHRPAAGISQPKCARSVTLIACDDVITTKEYVPRSAEIDEAMAARRGSKQILRHSDLAKLDNLEQKSLSAFSFGGNGLLLLPERSNIVLSCLADPSDLSGLVDKVPTANRLY